MDLLDRRILAGHIKTLRDACGQTYGQFAERLGVPIREVTAYETALRRPGYLASKRLYETAQEVGKPELEAYFKERMDAVLEWLNSRERYRRAMGKEA